MKTSTHTNKQKGDGNVEGTGADNDGEAAPQKRARGRPAKASKASTLPPPPPIEKPEAQNSIVTYAVKRPADRTSPTGTRTRITGLSPMSPLDERSDAIQAARDSQAGHTQCIGY